MTDFSVSKACVSSSSVFYTSSKAEQDAVSTRKDRSVALRAVLTKMCRYFRGWYAS